MARALTKTEKQILDRLENPRYQNRTSVQFGWFAGSTGRGKHRPYGERERKAALSLIQRGLVKIVNQYDTSDTQYGYRTHDSTTIVLSKVDQSA